MQFKTVGATQQNTVNIFKCVYIVNIFSILAVENKIICLF